LWAALGVPWELWWPAGVPLGAHLGPLGDPVGALWGLLGALGDLFGASWGALGPLLGAFGGKVGAFGEPL